MCYLKNQSLFIVAYLQTKNQGKMDKDFSVLSLSVWHSVWFYVLHIWCTQAFSGFINYIKTF